MTEPTKFAADFDYTDAELLAAFRQCLIAISITGQSYQIGTRIFTNANLAEVRTTINWLESRVATSNGTGPAEVVARMVRR